MSNQLTETLKIIQYKTGQPLDEIAKNIGYTRPYLSKAKKGTGDVSMIIGKLKDKYADVLLKDTSGIMQAGTEKGYPKKSDSLIDKEDRLIWAIASITKLSEEVVKLQAVTYGREVGDCVRELDYSIKLLIQRLKDAGT